MKREEKETDGIVVIGSAGGYAKLTISRQKFAGHDMLQVKSPGYGILLQIPEEDIRSLIKD